ncbi:MAG: YceI family protein [Acidimicrobiales bacterium]
MNQPPSPVPSEQAPAASPAPGTYRLDPDRSTVRADCKAMLGMMTVHGTLRLLAGEVEVAADPASSTVRATIDAASFASGNAARDRDVVSASLLDAAAHPEITFAANQVRGDGSEWVVPGVVTAHGTSVPVEVRLHEARMEGGVARFRASALLDRTSFGVTKKKGMVGRSVRLAVEAVGVPG